MNAEQFLVVLGGDCSILLGISAALKEIGHYGLITMDAHADYYFPEQSGSREATGMDIALITGNDPDIITNINDLKQYVHEEDIIHVGQRDEEDTVRYGST